MASLFTRLALVLLTAGPAIPAAGRGGGERSQAAEAGPQECRLLAAGSENLPSQACVACHDGKGERPFCPGHKVGNAYPDAGDAKYALRTRMDVLGRGIKLPGGNLECVTCHDRASPWESHLALPSGTRALPRIDPHDPSTYENRPNWRLTLPNARPRMPGQPVCPAMLCVVCHTFADPA